MSRARATRCASRRRRVRFCNIRCARWLARWFMSAKVNGAPAISPWRSPPATAPPAVRSPRRTGFIWCGWIIEWWLSEILLNNPPVHRGERDEVGNWRAFVDLMHGLADQAEFQHRTVILDEARIGGAAGGRKLRLAAGHFGDCRDGEIGERAGLGDKDVGIRRRPVERVTHAAGRGYHRALLDQRLERGLAVAVVIADVEARARFAGNEIDGRIADVHRGEFEVRWPKTFAALVERRLHRGHERHQTADRIVGAVRIGGVALAAGDDQRSV